MPWKTIPISEPVLPGEESAAKRAEQGLPVYTLALISSVAGISTSEARRRVEQPFQVDGLTSPALATAWIHPLETYTGALADSGLAITRLTEPHPSEQQLTSIWWREHFPRPLFLLITARKLGHSGSQ